jgi:hypothetical protein
VPFSGEILSFLSCIRITPFLGAGERDEVGEDLLNAASVRTGCFCYVVAKPKKKLAERRASSFLACRRSGLETL